MSTNRKYFYLKLKDNFYDQPQIQAIESMPDGVLYTNILLKMYLKSLSRDGKLVVTDVIPYKPDVLARVTGHEVGTVEKAVKIFKQYGLLEIMDNGEIYMLDIQNYVGKSSTEADRIREYRNHIKSVQNSYKSTPELELELKIEIDKKLDRHTNSLSKILKIYQTEYKKNKGIEAIVSSAVIDKLKRLLEDYKDEALIIKIIEKWFRDDYGDAWGNQVGYDITGKKMDTAIEKIITEIQKESKKEAKEDKYKITDAERMKWEKQDII